MDVQLIVWPVAGCGRREKEAFEKLIHEKKHMVMPAEVFERTSADDKFAALVADSVGSFGLLAACASPADR